MLHAILSVIQVVSSIGIVGLVLLQRGKGADAGAGFGAGASGTVFGARGSGSFLSHVTAVLAALFFVTSLTLAYLGGRPTTVAPTSVLDKAPVTAPQPATQTPAAPVNSAPANPSSAPETAPPAVEPEKPAENPAPK